MCRLFIGRRMSSSLNWLALHIRNDDQVSEDDARRPKKKVANRSSGKTTSEKWSKNFLLFSACTLVCIYYSTHPCAFLMLRLQCSMLCTKYPSSRSVCKRILLQLTTMFQYELTSFLTRHLVIFKMSDVFITKHHIHLPMSKRKGWNKEPNLPNKSLQIFNVTTWLITSIT